MDIKLYSVCLAILLLVVTSFIYGLKFLKKRNYLLGIELLIVTFSASNFLFYFLSGAHFAYRISFFLDAFSRGFGIPVIAVAGLMAVTHRYKPSILMDVVFFGAAIAGTVALVAADFVIQPRPYFYVVMWGAFSIYLAYFAKRLVSAGENLHAMGVILVLLSSQAIACIYDFYTIPGDDDHIVFYILAVTTWSFLSVELYYAYCALEGAEANEQNSNKVSTQVAPM
ncbi:hypothetical protein PTE30175_02637 [Pandoraea terrae]|uniref:Uncharacterized protein n=1 Tax=Pandoraea terrae TaxID=1537710 RepID=A0A5E4VKX8_9BURK|nr:hypothetical protein [Pandoraea terrae]VVE12543.1 hypothetical protein PTE30175_02637 [Pandoraea terrae]